MMPQIEAGLVWLQERVPTVAAVLLLLVAGWFVARLARAGLRRGAAAIGAGDGIATRFFNFVAELLFWLILIAFAVAAIQVTRAAGPMPFIDEIGSFLPGVLGGAAILVGGTLLSVIVRDLTVRSLSQLGVEQARVFGRVLQIVVLATAFVVGMDQIGVRVAFLVTMLAILAGGVVFSVGLAFALGAAGLVKNLLAARDARRHYSPGQRVRIGDTEGELIEITPTVIVLAAQGARVTVPACVFHESAITLIDPVSGRG